MKLSDITPDMLRTLTDNVRGAGVVAMSEEIFIQLLEKAIIEAQLGKGTVSLSGNFQKEQGQEVMEAVNEKMVARGFISRGTGIDPFGRSHRQKIYYWGW